MNQNLSLPVEIGFSLKPPKFVRKAAGAVVHSTAVNISNVKKAVTSDTARRIAAVVAAPLAPIVSVAILPKKDKEKLVHAVKVNTANVVKAAKKVSMNKIVDAFTPDVILPEEESGFKKMLPLLAAGGAGLLLLL